MAGTDNIKAPAAQPAVQPKTGVKAGQAVKKSEPQIGEIMTAGAKAGKVAAPETPGEKTGGVVFGEGALKKLETKEERIKSNNGTYKTHIKYTAILTDGTVVEYDDHRWLSGEKKLQPSIKKNKDGSFDFTGLNGAIIRDTPKDDMYNLLGCKFTEVHANRGKDSDVIDFANVAADDDTIVVNDDVAVFYNANDEVSDIDYPFGSPELQEYDGDMYGTSSCGDYDEDSSRAKYDRPYSVKNEYIGNARIKRTEREFDRAATTEFIAHDGTKLKESYVNAKEQVLADGYKIRTSPDGKEQWFYTPEGKPISKAEFKNRGLE